MLRLRSCSLTIYIFHKLNVHNHRIVFLLVNKSPTLDNSLDKKIKLFNSQSSKLSHNEIIFNAAQNVRHNGRRRHLASNFSNLIRNLGLSSTLK